MPAFISHVIRVTFTVLTIILFGTADYTMDCKKMLEVYFVVPGMLTFNSNYFPFFLNFEPLVGESWGKLPEHLRGILIFFRNFNFYYLQFIYIYQVPGI